MLESEFKYHRKGDPFTIMPRDIIENSPMIVALKQQFASMIPSNFGQARVHISPIAATNSVIRADCRNNGCGVRATQQITQNEYGWNLAQEHPEFSRGQNNPCNSCKPQVGSNRL